MKQASIALLGLILLSACSSNQTMAQNTYSASAHCSAMGFSPGSASYTQCIDNDRIRQDVIARKAFNGNKNQPDGVLAQTYGKPMGLSINCTSYGAPAAGSANLCD